MNKNSIIMQKNKLPKFRGASKSLFTLITLIEFYLKILLCVYFVDC